MTEADYVKRFGSLAMSKGFITMEHFLRAMQIQVKEEMESGAHRLIGEILVDMGAMDTSQLKQVLKIMK